MSQTHLIEAVVEPLRRHPPFDRLPDAALRALAGAARIRHLPAGAVLFEQGARPHDDVYVVRKGAIAVRREVDGASILLDRCDAGAVLGARAHIAGTPYAARAEAEEDALIVALPYARLGPMLEAHPALALFFAAGFAVGLPRTGERIIEATERARRRWALGAEADEDDRAVMPSRSVLTCAGETTVQAAAQAMAARGVGSIIVADAEQRPRGIMTDVDLRARVVAEGLDPARTPVGDVMSSPVATVAEGVTAVELLGRMMRRRIHHFCVTADGTPDTAITGVISDRDVLSSLGTHPTSLMRRIGQAPDAETLRALRARAERLIARYLEQERAMRFVAGVAAAIDDAATRRALSLALEASGPPPVAFCWLALGSEGREERLLRTDQDNALVYVDPPPAQAEAAQAWFLGFGERVTDLIAASGVVLCPGGVMARNPAWCQPLSRWKATFSKWIRTPEPRALMHADIAFDLRPVEGDRALAEALRDHIFAELDAERGFLNFLAANALRNPPPLSFFRQFIVERSGAHESAFDLKSRAMMPLCDAARVLAHAHRLTVYGSTPRRFRALAAAEPERAGLFEEAAVAYEMLMRRRAQSGLAHGDSGRFVPIDELGTLQRRSLRNIFAVIDEVQGVLRSRFRTDFIR